MGKRKIVIELDEDDIRFCISGCPFIRYDCENYCSKRELGERQKLVEDEKGNLQQTRSKWCWENEDVPFMKIDGYYLREKRKVVKDGDDWIEDALKEGNEEAEKCIDDSGVVDPSFRFKLK